jgi:hypothetical protein
MEMNEKLARELKKKFEIELSRREAEVLEHWKVEIDVIYKKKYESLGALQVDIRKLTERMNNRINVLMRTVKEGI